MKITQAPLEHTRTWIDAAYAIVHQRSIENPESWNSEESFFAMSSEFRLMRQAPRSTS